MKGGTCKGRWSAEAGFPLEDFDGTVLNWGGMGGTKAQGLTEMGPERSSYASPTQWHPQCKHEPELGEESRDSDLFDLGVGSDVCVVGKELLLFEISRHKLTPMWI